MAIPLTPEEHARLAFQRLAELVHEEAEEVLLYEKFSWAALSHAQLAGEYMSPLMTKSEILDQLAGAFELGRRYERKYGNEAD